MKYSYSIEKLSHAVENMATSPESLQQRLANAYIYDLIHVHDDALPEEAVEDFRWIKAQLTSVAASGDEGKIMATVRTLDDEAAQEIARKIVDVYFMTEGAARLD